MSWGNGWAWLGLFALGAPVLIHLLSRRQARTQPFPTLRFLAASRLAPSRRTQLSDIPLLVVRLAILAAAVAALAQPLFSRARHTNATGTSVARVILVDTSASMLRPAASGERALDAARREAQRLAGDASPSIVVQSIAPTHAIGAAVEWLAGQPGRHEIAFVSDFQLGSIAVQDVKSIPSDVGLRFVRIDVRAEAGPVESVVRTDVGETVARATVAADHTDVDWTVRPGGAGNATDIALLVGSGEGASVGAARRAAVSLASLPPVAGHPVAIVYSHYDQRAALRAAAKPVDKPWMGDVVLRLRHDSTVNVSSGMVGGREQLLLFPSSDPGSLASASLIAGVSGALAPRARVGEMERESVPAATLARWERPAGAARAQGSTGDSNGRWLWILALALLALETWMRRQPGERLSTESAA